jgi:hypothetical protein
MAIGKHLTEETRSAIESALRDGMTIAETARIYGSARNTVRNIKHIIETEDRKQVEYPKFIDGDEDESVEEILERRRKAFQRKQTAAEARRWFEIKIPETLPYAVIWFGDPHIDNDGCNWPLLERHLEIARMPGVYAGNIGDTTDNWPWTGRLAKLWAETDMSDKTAKKMAEWFMFDAGVKWLVWLLGNHDAWNGGTDFYKRLGASYVPVIDWRAQFVLSHKTGAKTRIDAAHGRKGNSIYNPSHGTLRASRFGEPADLFVTGHIHSFKLDHFEDADRKHISWLAQVRGYKWHDSYAHVNSFAEHQHGAAIMSIIDPQNGRVQCFADLDEGAEYLAWKRSRVR